MGPEGEGRGERTELLILGIGNILLGDEGVGVRAVEELKRRMCFREDVLLVDGGTMGFELLPYLEEARRLMIIDAVETGEVPGSVVKIEVEDPPGFFRQKISPHQVGLADLFGVAALSGCLPERITLYGVVPETLETGLGLSPTVAEGMERLVALVAADLAKMGFLESDAPAALS